MQEDVEDAETNEEESVAGGDDMSGAMTTALPAPSVQSLAPHSLPEGFALASLAAFAAESLQGAFRVWIWRHLGWNLLNWWARSWSFVLALAFPLVLWIVPAISCPVSHDSAGVAGPNGRRKCRKTPF